MTTAASRVEVTRLASQAIESWRPVSDPHLAHAPQWATVIERAYGHRPLYLGAEDVNGHRAFVPAFIVRRPLVGPVITSMPFLDGGGPSIGAPDLDEPLVGQLVEEARRIGAGFVELRCARKLAIAAAPLEHKVNLVLRLAADPDVVWRRFDKGRRQQIQKSERSGLSVESGGAPLIDAFYSVFVSRMRELGSPVHAKEFFAAIVNSFGDRARVVIVRKRSTPIGGLIALATGDTLTVPWASCLTEYRSDCPNMLLYWDTIRTGCRDGFRRFDFGRSTRGSGTYQFKVQWAAEEQPLFWYTIPVGDAAAHAETSDAGKETFVRVWRRLPLGLTRRLGPRVRKYLIQ